jgi:hypothetical protein
MQADLWLKVIVTSKCVTWISGLLILDFTENNLYEMHK